MGLWRLWRDERKMRQARELLTVARLTRELSEERKQRTATSEVLHLLSGSHGDLGRPIRYDFAHEQSGTHRGSVMRQRSN